MPVLGLDWLTPTRALRNFFARFGVIQGGIRGVLNAVIPVAIIDRYRDDHEGSIFAITGDAIDVPAGQHAAFAIGSAQDDWELLALQYGVWYHPVGAGTTQVHNLMLYTPDSTYNPIVNPSPVGFYIPGLNPDFAFTLGSVFLAAGFNPTVPIRWGFFPFPSHFQFTTAPVFFENSVRFDPPIRIYREITLGLVDVHTHPVQHDARISFTYRIRPRTSSGPVVGT